MANSILTRIENLEKQKRIKQLPDSMEAISVAEALILPRYLKDAPLATLDSYKALLLSWEKKLGKRDFAEYTRESLSKRQANKKRQAPNNQGQIQRMRELQKHRVNAPTN